MAKLDTYLTRKQQAIADRQADWTAAPEKAVVSISASSKVAGITGARPIRMGSHSVLSDSAPGLAGHALGPTSPELLLGALASCLVHTYLIQAVLLAIPIDDVEVEISGTLDYKKVIGMPSSHPLSLENIHYHARVESPAAAETIDQLHAAVEQNCPVLNTIRNPVDVRRDA